MEIVIERPVASEIITAAYFHWLERNRSFTKENYAYLYGPGVLSRKPIVVMYANGPHQGGYLPRHRREGENHRVNDVRPLFRKVQIPICIAPYQCPRNWEGHPMAVPMRIEVIQRDGSNEHVTEKLKEFINERLEISALSTGNVDLEWGEVLVVPIEGTGQSRLIFQFKATTVDWQYSLSQFACRIHGMIRVNEHWQEYLRYVSDMPILYTHSTLIYPLRLINQHREIPIKRLKFGSITQELFRNRDTLPAPMAIHWVVEGGRKKEGDEKSNFTFDKDLDVSFEYDRMQITIMFKNKEAHPDYKYNGEFEALYKITVNMKSIKKLGLDQRDIDDDGRNVRRSLVMHLDYAPKIQVKLRNVNCDQQPNQERFSLQSNGTGNQEGPSNGNSPYRKGGQRNNNEPYMRYGEYEHRLQICRGEYPGEMSNRTALHESKIIILEFDEEHINDKFESKESEIHQLIFDILSRLCHKTRKNVEFTSYDQLLKIEGRIWEYSKDVDKYELIKIDPYDVTEFDDYVLSQIQKASTKLVCGENMSLAYKVPIQIELKQFKLRAFLEGILQRGMEIRCQMLCNKYHWYSFVEEVCDKYALFETKTLNVLESLLTAIAEGRPHWTVMNLFDKEWSESQFATRTNEFTQKEKDMGYTRIMKFVLTPTRLFFVGYETLMANRVLSQYSKNGTEIIRVSFSHFMDDSNEYMRKMSSGERIIYNTMRGVLIDDGVTFAGRSYVWLGNSNSQLRDHGIYMFHETKIQTARGIRKNLGNFDLLTSIPKWLARQGQCFTQARASKHELRMGDVGIAPDFIGGMTSNDENGKPYCFSDGVGTISFILADELGREHGLPKTPSAFQIRHKGQKGLLAVDPLIDGKNKLLKRMGKEETKKINIRPSMDKFDVEEAYVNNKSDAKLEIVKYSSASPLTLNRPMINILSQVSENQSAGCRKRMSNRIYQLLDIQLRNTIHSLYIEEKAREAVKEMSFPFCMEVFTASNPLKFTSEPFFRSLLTAYLRYVLNRQLAKMQIRIPSDLGRSMFGIVDTTGILQYGQIFCQYSSSTSKHMATRSDKGDGSTGAPGAIILTGPVMMTKNPCIEKGDVRRFEAVDVPGLRHYVDVVVFPMHGPRPHPDEMAGSDLDGDDYCLIWDPQILFDHNEEASNFPSGENVEKWPIAKYEDGTVDIEACEEMLANFYIEAVTQEQVGVLSHAHLATSDYHGLENKTARSLARKIAQSLDFQKNGIQPEDRTLTHKEDPDDPTRVIPPEKAVRKPDYMEKFHDATYESRGIMGSIFKEIKRYQHAIDLSEDKVEMIKLDPDFNVPGWKKYESAVKREMATYCHGIRDLMERYGVVSEGELMSGHIVTIKNRISDKEVDDMNLYNTNQVIEDKVKREIAGAREAFFSPLINWQKSLEKVDTKRKDVDEESILSRVVRSSTENMDKLRMKAGAAYNLCYEEANRLMANGEQTSIILSFPWIFYDVLSDIKIRPGPSIERVLPAEIVEHSNEPLAIELSTFIDGYCTNEANLGRYAEFKNEFREASIIRRFMDENEGLARASFVLVQWANHIGLQRGAKFNQNHLIALFFQFGLGEVHVRGTRRRYIQRPSGEVRVHLKKGEHLLKFIDYLASREFRTRDYLSFGDIMEGALMRGEWKTFAELCISAYLTLVTTHRLDLPMKEDEEAELVRKSAILKEYEPRKMELPEGVIKTKLNDVRRDLMMITGCRDIQIRQMGSATEVLVSAIGTSENFKVLDSFVISPAPSRDQAASKEYFFGIPKLVYDRLMRAAIDAFSLPCL